MLMKFSSIIQLKKCVALQRKNLEMVEILCIYGIRWVSIIIPFEL